MMAVRPTKLRLSLAPDHRVETIDVLTRIADEPRDILRRHRRALYWSPHTTAGYVEEPFLVRLRHDRERLARFVGEFGEVFPAGADYRHDRMELRSELSDAEKQIEPRNADSHLTYIGAGVRNCVTYKSSDRPVYFIDLDGTNDAMRRQRETSILAYDAERVVARASLEVPVSGDAFDAIDLADPRFAVLARADELLTRSGIEHGRVDFSLGPRERGAALTVNEFETLLMRHDLMDALRSPVHFARMSGRLAGSRGVSLPAGAAAGGGVRIVRGRYQSPILVQWRSLRRQVRRLDIAIVELSCEPVSSLMAVPCPLHVSR
jgi:hypothetical protein